MSKQLTRRVIPFVVTLLLLSLSAHAKAGLIKRYTVWNGLKRYFAVYTPRTLAATPSLVLFLNATSQNAPDNPPYYGIKAWQTLADQYGFVVGLPISSYNPTVKTWYWNVYETDSTFTINPDDAGFLRWFITSLQAQYRIAPGNTFVTGMSSGGFMAHRVGTDLSDIVAAIAPVSGMIDVHPIGQNFLPPPPILPVSVYELHGDQDAIVPYCGGIGFYWGGLHDAQPSIDDTVNFWIKADGCADRSTLKPLCTNGQATNNVNGQDATACNYGVEVLFAREVGLGHTWVTGTEAKVWAFFRTHARP